jgi:two-component system OmpR family sensor kinase
VLAAIGLVTVLQAGIAYRSALREADRMFDFHLEEVARSVHGGVPFAPGDDASDYSVQVGARTDTRCTAPTARAAFAGGAGLFGLARQRRALRVYTLQTPEHTIQIAQDLDAREARRTLRCGSSRAAVLLLAPLLMLAVGAVIGGSLAPLTRMRSRWRRARRTTCRRSARRRARGSAAAGAASSMRCSRVCAARLRRSSISSPMRRTSCAPR